MKSPLPTVAVAVLLFLSCSGLRPVTLEDPEGGATRFHAYRVVHSAPDHLALEIRYTYDGSYGDKRVFVGAISTREGQSLGHWGYRPDPVFPGTHWARVRLGLNDSAPLLHRTDGLELSMYVGGGSAFHEVTVPFEKTWLRLPRWLQGHERWGAGCGGS